MWHTMREGLAPTHPCLLDPWSWVLVTTDPGPWDAINHTSWSDDLPNARRSVFSSQTSLVSFYSRPRRDEMLSKLCAVSTCGIAVRCSDHYAIGLHSIITYNKEKQLHVFKSLCVSRDHTNSDYSNFAGNYCMNFTNDIWVVLSENKTDSLINSALILTLQK